MVIHTSARPASILIVVFSIVFSMFLSIATPAKAVTLLRDADLEYSLSRLAAPVLSAAGLSTTRTKILVVKDPSLNAFVISNDAIYIHSGLIMRMENAAMLQAVIAHEAAHIANGHITRRMANIGAARNAAALGTALAVLAGAAGAGDAAAAIALGSSSAAERNFLAHTRAEEAAADQSGARYLTSAGIPLSGMSDVFRLFRGQESLSAGRQDPYVRSHPLSRDRLRAIEAYAATGANAANSDQSSANYWFARSKGKLTASQRRASWTLNRLEESGYRDVALLRKAVAENGNGQSRKALSTIDDAISLRPDDPFLYDIKAEILMDLRQFSASANTAARAIALRPNDGLLQARYGRALLAADQLRPALSALERARQIDFRDGSMLRDLSVAYARLGQNGMASLITAERYALSGRLKDAGIHAKRATGLLPVGSGPWQRASDVLAAAERAERNRRR